MPVSRDNALSVPGIILLADRLTYLNKRYRRVLEVLGVAEQRHFHSAHGHLSASDLLVPIVFVRGERKTSICEASLVDTTRPSSMVLSTPSPSGDPVAAAEPATFVIPA
jgi:hypothetical protein